MRLGQLPHPALLASPSFLGSFADSLPTLALDPFLAPFLAALAAWPRSPSPVLRAAHAAFGQLAPLLAGSVTAADASCRHQTLRALLTAPDGSLSIHLLPPAAGRRPQHSFSHALFAYVTRHLLSSDSPLSALAQARLRHAAVPPAPMLFQMYYVPIPRAADPNCPSYKTAVSDAVRTLLAHAYHQLSCGATGRLIRRHDSLAKIIGQAASTHLNAPL